MLSRSDLLESDWKMTTHTYAGHTAEPWAVSTSNSRIRISTTGRHARDGAVVDVASDSRGRPVLLIRPEDARRIVACVNALAGWKTETIERYATDGAPGRPNLGQAFHELKQRAERAEGWHMIETGRADELQESIYLDRDEIAGLQAQNDQLLAACRKAVLALAHAAERHPVYRRDYDALSTAIDAARAQPAE